MNKKIIRLLLISILILAFGLRIYKIAEVPPSISWDEAAVGVNAWNIANYGRDEYGKFFPPYFHSFGEDKNPVDVYLTALFVKFMDLNELSTRLPVALFGVLNVFIIYILGKLLFEKESVGLISAFFLAISPFNLHFSHFNHEANFALFFLMSGIILFLLSIKKEKRLLPFSIISFCLSFISYNPPKIVVPAVLVLLFVLYAKKLFKKLREMIFSLSLLGLFLILIFFNQALLGGARIGQTIQGRGDIEKTQVFKITHSELLGRINLMLVQYTWHFSPQFLFISGDKNPRLSSQSAGEFYKLDALFLILGAIYLFARRTKESFLLLGLALVAPLPSSITADAPHAGRAMFMMGSWHIIAAVGLYALISSFKKLLFRWGIIILCLGVLTLSLKDYLIYYYGEYTKRYAIEWQYGMKQIVEYVKLNPEYSQVFMTDIRSQPYIFFLYYLKMPLNEYLNTVVYNNSESKSYNNVAYFGRYFFAGWDPIESFPNKGALYIVSPSQYDGLRYKSSFDIKKKVIYPNGLDAFFIVSAK